ncbi:MAG TPA: hypothetical protein VMF86_16320 [Stellaceae bacterium]|nr:hypothetical protein [Stellaceae bacterium]
MAWEALTYLIKRGIARGSRSNVLASLIWILALMTAAFVGSIAASAPAAAQFLFGGLMLVSFVFAMGWYSYFAIKDPDALRSERFVIQKLSIEHGLIGDSTTGVFPAAELDASRDTADAQPSPLGSATEQDEG